MNITIYREAEKRIMELAQKYSNELEKQIGLRMLEMKGDDTSHFLIYRVLGITLQEGEKIDIYQNKGRFLYKYAGSFLEEAAIICFELSHPNAIRKTRIPNNLGVKPKTFEIDCLIEQNAYEIKWRDATTDGDHITKEHTRVKCIKGSNLIPIRLMFYYPNRTQAIKIQETLKTIYEGLNGQYYFGDGAWRHLKDKTGIDLLEILTYIANTNDKRKYDGYK